VGRAPDRHVEAERAVPEVIDGRGKDGQRDAVGSEVIAACAGDADEADHSRRGDATERLGASPREDAEADEDNHGHPGVGHQVGGIQKESRPISRCQRMSQLVPQTVTRWAARSVQRPARATANPRDVSGTATSLELPHVSKPVLSVRNPLLARSGILGRSGGVTQAPRRARRRPAMTFP
jgi:hypothetical protein